MDNIIRVNIQSKDFMPTLLTAFNNSGKREFVIVNIGTDKCIGDCFAPFLGTLLKDNTKLNNIHVYGTLDDPIHALNLRKNIESIKTNHPDAFILAIDACIGDKSDIGKMFLKNRPIKPGAGMDKKLPHIGDYSIIAIVQESTDYSFLTFKTDIRLSFIRNLSLIAFNELVKIDENLTLNKENELYEVV